jgi:hypothetical protein
MHMRARTHTHTHTRGKNFTFSQLFPSNWSIRTFQNEFKASTCVVWTAKINVTEKGILWSPNVQLGSVPSPKIPQMTNQLYVNDAICSIILWCYLQYHTVMLSAVSYCDAICSIILWCYLQYHTVVLSAVSYCDAICSIILWCYLQYHTGVLSAVSYCDAICSIILWYYLQYHTGVEILNCCKTGMQEDSSSAANDIT